MPPDTELQLNASNFHLYFAVRSRDDAGNFGDVSNVALAHFRDPEALRIIRGDPDNLHRTLLAVIVAIVGAAIVVAIVLIVCKVRSNKKKKYECQKRKVVGDNNGHQTTKLLA